MTKEDDPDAYAPPTSTAVAGDGDAGASSGDAPAGRRRDSEGRSAAALAAEGRDTDACAPREPRSPPMKRLRVDEDLEDHDQPPRSPKQEGAAQSGPALPEAAGGVCERAARFVTAVGRLFHRAGCDCLHEDAEPQHPLLPGIFRFASRTAGEVGGYSACGECAAGSDSEWRPEGEDPPTPPDPQDGAGRYVTRSAARRFHRGGCEHLRTDADPLAPCRAGLRRFEGIVEAEAAGYAPCECCFAMLDEQGYEDLLQGAVPRVHASDPGAVPHGAGEVPPDAAAGANGGPGAAL